MKLLVLVCVLFTSNGFQPSHFTISQGGYRFQSTNNVQLIFLFSNIRTVTSCAILCYRNALCRTFDFDSSSHQCDLFEGSVNTGTLISTVITTVVGWITMDSSMFTLYNATNDQCIDNRFLVSDTISGRCQCPIHTFWDGSLCSNQRFDGDTCTSNSWCRGDLNIICIASICVGSTTSSIASTVLTSYTDTTTVQTSSSYTSISTITSTTSVTSYTDTTTVQTSSLYTLTSTIPSTTSVTSYTDTTTVQTSSSYTSISTIASTTSVTSYTDTTTVQTSSLYTLTSTIPSTTSVTSYTDTTTVPTSTSYTLNATILSTTSVTSATTTVATCTTLVNFDDIPGELSTSGIIPNGYKNLNWINAEYINVSTTSSSSGYRAGVISSPFVMHNPTGGNLTITSANGTQFSFDSLHLTSAWRNPLNVTMKLISTGWIAAQATYSLSTAYSYTISCDMCSDMDTITFETNAGIIGSNFTQNGTQFIVDNLCISFGY